MMGPWSGLGVVCSGVGASLTELASRREAALCRLRTTADIVGQHRVDAALAAEAIAANKSVDNLSTEEIERALMRAIDFVDRVDVVESAIEALRDHVQALPEPERVEPRQPRKRHRLTQLGKRVW